VKKSCPSNAFVELFALTVCELFSLLWVLLEVLRLLLGTLLLVAGAGAGDATGAGFGSGTGGEDAGTQD
jgi:hypothetical protein